MASASSRGKLRVLAQSLAVLLHRECASSARSIRATPVSLNLSSGGLINSGAEAADALRGGDGRGTSEGEASPPRHHSGPNFFQLVRKIDQSGGDLSTEHKNSPKFLSMLAPCIESAENLFAPPARQRGGGNTSTVTFGLLNGSSQQGATEDNSLTNAQNPQMHHTFPESHSEALRPGAGSSLELSQLLLGLPRGDASCRDAWRAGVQIQPWSLSCLMAPRDASQGVPDWRSILSMGEVLPGDQGKLNGRVRRERQGLVLEMPGKGPEEVLEASSVKRKRKKKMNKHKQRKLRRRDKRR